MVEGGVDHARRNPVGDERSQRRLALAAREPHPVARLETTVLGIDGMNLEHVLLVPHDVGGATGLGTDIVLRQDATRRQQQREARPGLLVGRHVIRYHEQALAAHEARLVHDRRPVRESIVDRPLQRSFRVQSVEGDAREGRGQPRDLVHDLCRVRVVPLQAHCIGERLRDLPVLKAVGRFHHLAHKLDAAFGIGESAVLFEEGRTGKEDMRVVGRLVEKQVVDDDAFHRSKPRRDMLRIGIALQDVLTLDVDRPE